MSEARACSSRLIAAIIVAITAAATACDSGDYGLPPHGQYLQVGRWGADGASMTVTDSAIALLIGCTSGTGPAPVRLDEHNEFDVHGSYSVHLYPVAFGPPMPARFIGTSNGLSTTITVVVTDTTDGSTTVEGPVTVLLGKQPVIGPCPLIVDRGPGVVATNPASGVQIRGPRQ